MWIMVPWLISQTMKLTNMAIWQDYSRGHKLLYSYVSQQASFDSFILLKPVFWRGFKTWICFSLHSSTPNFWNLNFVSLSLGIYVTYLYLDPWQIITVCIVLYQLDWQEIFCMVSVFELARGLRDSHTSINNKDLDLLVKKEAENLCKGNISSSFLCVLTFSSVICRPIHLFIHLFYTCHASPYYDIMGITSTARCNQPNTKTHFTEKRGRNVMNTSINHPSSTLFKMTSWWNQIAHFKLTTFSQINVISFSGSEPCNPKFATPHFLTNYPENWKLTIFLIIIQVMVFAFVCLFSARVKD